MPIQRVSCGVPYLLLPLRSRESVDRAFVDRAGIRALGEAMGEDLAVFVFSLDHARETTAYARMFAPQDGIVEDPATGSAAGPLGAYLFRHGAVSAGEARRMVQVQGVAMGRPSRIEIDIPTEGDAITGVRVGGRAVLAGRCELYL